MITVRYPQSFSLLPSNNNNNGGYGSTTNDIATSKW